MIHFVNSIEEIPEYPLSRTILIDDSLQSERDVIERIEQALDSPYDKDNWDGFNDVLCDLQWLKESQVVLIHKSLPHLTSRDLRIYLEILESVSSLWADKDRWLAQHRALWCLVDEELAKPADSYNYIDFQVYFLVDDKEKIDFFLPGKFPQPEVRWKRAPATHIGDIFEIPLPGDRKRYMQFILVDSSQLGAWTVRVFKKEYSIDNQPSIDSIIEDRVDFYMNTRALGIGILEGLWSRYGKSDNLGNLNKVVFRYYHDGLGFSPSRWWVWKAAQPVKRYKILPLWYLSAAEGSMSPPYGVVHRIVTGRWFPFTNLYDDYKTAPLIDKIRIRGIGKITDKYIVPKRPAKTRKG